MPSAKFLLLFDVKALGEPQDREEREKAAKAFLRDSGFAFMFIKSNKASGTTPGSPLPMGTV